MLLLPLLILFLIVILILLIHLPAWRRVGCLENVSHTFRPWDKFTPPTKTAARQPCDKPLERLAARKSAHPPSNSLRCSPAAENRPLRRPSRAAAGKPIARDRTRRQSPIGGFHPAISFHPIPPRPPLPRLPSWNRPAVPVPGYEPPQTRCFHPGIRPTTSVGSGFA